MLPRSALSPRFLAPRALLSTLILAAALALPGLASAQSSGAKEPDLLTLQDGTTVRGKFIEFVPGERVTVLSGGESKTFHWKLVRTAAHDGKIVAENAQLAQLPPPVTAQPPRPVAPPAAPGSGGQGALEDQVFVHLEGEEDAVLEQQDRGRTGFRLVCSAPCDRLLPLDRMYRIRGEGLRDSKPFRLAGQNGQHVIVHVNGGSSSAFVGGIVMTSIGPVALLAGLVVYAAGALQNFTFDTSGSSAQSSSGDNTGLKTTGVVMMIGGVALVAVGIPLFVTNRRTKTEQEIDGSRPREAAKIRLPEYRDKAHEVPAPAAPWVPVYTTTF